MTERSQTAKGQLARTKILRAAEDLIAAHGFHAASMRDIAAGAELPLATVVYHFARKEQIHAAILQDIAGTMLGAMADEEPVLALVRWSLAHPDRVRLLLRELLDNPSRVQRATILPLGQVLKSLADRLNVPELAVLHFFGAVSYVIVARPTVKRILGVAKEREMMESYEASALALARVIFEEMSDGARAANRDGSANPRPRGGKDDGRGAKGDTGGNGGVRRRGQSRAGDPRAVPR